MAAISPQNLTDRALEMLKEHADPNSAQTMQRFFKPYEQIKSYGIKTAKVRDIARQICGDIQKDWRLADAVRFCEQLIAEPHLESKMLGIFVLARFKRKFDRTILHTVHAWLDENQCDNWAVTDTISTLILTSLVRKFPEMLSEIKSRVYADNLWVRRSAAVCLTPLARKGEHLDAAYEIAALLFNDKEDLIHKATGWLLREAGKTDLRRLESFLTQHGPRIPRTALRYAIEKFPAEKRKEILEHTKS